MPGLAWASLRTGFRRAVAWTGASSAAVVELAVAHREVQRFEMVIGTLCASPTP